MRFICIVLHVVLGASIAHGQTFTYSSSGGNISISSTGKSVAMVNGQVISGSKVVDAIGPVVSEDRQTSSYTGLHISAPVEFHYTVAAKPMLRVYAPANIIPLVKTSVHAGELVVKMDGAVILKESLRVVASGPSLVSLSSDGSGRIRVEGHSGSELRMRVSGSGDVVASGKAQYINAKITGSGSINATNLRVEDVAVEVKGSGNARVFANLSAQIELTGSGSVTVLGQPGKRDVLKTGSGQIFFN